MHMNGNKPFSGTPKRIYILSHEVDGATILTSLIFDQGYVGNIPRIWPKMWYTNLQYF